MDRANLPVSNNSSTVTAQQLVADFSLVLSDIDALIRATANQRGGEIAKVRTKAADTVAAMRTRVADAEVALLDKAKQVSKIANDYVRESPWQNLGVAAGVGLLIGLFIGRR